MVEIRRQIKCLLEAVTHGSAGSLAGGSNCNVSAKLLTLQFTMESLVVWKVESFDCPGEWSRSMRFSDADMLPEGQICFLDACCRVM
jgi:hypothetical protein